jgi:hypothetical protein
VRLPHSRKPRPVRLVAICDEIARLDMQLRVLRLERDQLVRELVESKAFTWREIADLGGFENPYIARITLVHRVSTTRT